MTPAPSRLGRLLRPQTVAFIGGAMARGAREVCEQAGFEGPIWEVHPTRSGAYRQIADLPAAPDAAFVAVNARATVDVVGELAAAGAGGAACYAAGFSEAGTPEGAALEDELRRAAGEMPVLGPNCYGVIDALAGVSVWPVPWPREQLDRGVAMILQSGNLGINVTMSQRSVPLAFVASVGNQAVLEIAELVDAYAGLDEVTAIGIYLEGLRDVPRFAEAAGRALERGVPLAVCKAGTSELGRELAYTHTASLAGSDELYEALFARYGIARARTVPELLETVKALTVTGPLAGRQCFVFTCSGAESALAADAASAARLELPQPGEPTRTALAEVLPEFALVGNPLDYNSALWGQEEPLRRVFETALRDPVDAALLVIDYPRPGVPYAVDVDNAIGALCAATAGAGVPGAVASVLPESFQEHGRLAVAARGVSPLQGLDEAFAALGACARFGERLRAGTPPPYPALRSAPDGPRPLDEGAAKELLATVGIETPRGTLVRAAGTARTGSEDVRLAAAAAAAAQEVGFPAVAKLASPELPHKADAGAVALGLDDAGAVAEAVRAMLARNPVTAISGVLVERMVDGAVCELLVGIRYDRSFGHVLVVGSGGGLVELIGDVAPVLFPVTREDAEAALRRLRLWPRLALGDVDAAIGVVLALARLVEQRGHELAELEVNPLLVLEHGAVAVDALCRIRA